MLFCLLQKTLHKMSKYDWNKTIVISDAFKQLFNNSFMADVKLTFDDGQTLYAHKMVLCLRSFTLHENFNIKSIMLENRSYNITRQFLKYLYSDECDLEPNNVFELLEMSKEFCVPPLETLCEKYLCSSLHPLQSLKISLKNDMGQLKAKSLIYIAENFASTLIHSEFLEIDSQTLSAVLKLEAVSNPEEFEMFKCVLFWAEEKCRKNSADDIIVDGIMVREVLGENLKLIRFPAMTNSEFANVIELKSGLLTEAECVSIFLNIATGKKNRFEFNDEPRSLIENTSSSINDTTNDSYKENDDVEYDSEESYVESENGKDDCNEETQDINANCETTETTDYCFEENNNDERYSIVSKNDETTESDILVKKSFNTLDSSNEDVANSSTIDTSIMFKNSSCSSLDEATLLKSVENKIDDNVTTSSISKKSRRNRGRKRDKTSSCSPSQDEHMTYVMGIPLKMHIKNITPFEINKKPFVFVFIAKHPIQLTGFSFVGQPRPVQLRLEKNGRLTKLNVTSPLGQVVNFDPVSVNGNTRCRITYNFLDLAQTDTIETENKDEAPTYFRGGTRTIKCGFIFLVHPIHVSEVYYNCAV